jgi:hypothetical protein
MLIICIILSFFYIEIFIFVFSKVSKITAFYADFYSSFAAKPNIWKLCKTNLSVCCSAALVLSAAENNKIKPCKTVPLGKSTLFYFTDNLKFRK